MEHGDAEDPTVPNARAGVDPLLAYPKEATGQTGQIERPGDQTPWWFIPGLCAVAVFFIGLLATISNDRNSDRIAAEEQAAASAAPEIVDGADTAQESEEAPGPADSLPVSEPIDAEVQAATDPRIDDLPTAGQVRVGDAEFEIVSRCEVQLPFEPADTDFQVSSYFFFDDARERQLIDRVFDGETDRAQLLDDSEFVQIDEIGDGGAFVATFARANGGEFDVVVNPGSDAEQCGDRVVTNEPGQFAEPHTRIVMDVCIDRTTDAFATVVGLTSEGARFEVLQAGGELGELVFVERNAPAMRTAAPAFIIRSGDITSVSGVVSEGANDLDIAIDIGTDIAEADARTCAQSDRL